MFRKEFSIHTFLRWYDMNEKSQMLGGKNWLLPKK
jgi:hypothetical protein